MFFGGINVYLQQKAGLFRHTPAFFDRLLDGWLLRKASGGSVSIDAQQLGDLTLSMLEGSHGKQRKEVAKLADAIANEFRPDVVVLTNVLLSGLVPELTKRWHGPVLATLQGDDIFLEQLPADARKGALERIQVNCQHVDGFVATSRYYADFMAGYFGLPHERIHVVYPGINPSGFQESTATRSADTPLTIGYFARIAPEKGLHLLAEAFVRLRQMTDAPKCRLRFAGYLGKHNEPYLADVMKTLKALPRDDVEHLDCPDRASKIRFFQGIDVLSVPSPYRDPKGLYVFESLACGVPVVQPRHGSFPEWIEATGGGLLFEPNDPASLAGTLKRLLLDADLRCRLGTQGRQAVHDRFTAQHMATKTIEILQQYTERK
jgi:glycosyltransferase involved in cell wall biosynthesis